MGRTGHQGERDTEEGEGAGRKRIDLSLSQVVGAGVATLAAATAASYLNVYGTVIGAAVMAALSTVASPFLQHWFSRGGDQARQLAGKAVGHAAPAGTGARRSGPPDAGTGAKTPPAAPGPSQDPDATLPLPRPGKGATARIPDVGDPTGYGSAAEAEPGRRGWRARVLPAAAVFVLAMLVILLFELFTGRSLTAWTQGQQEHTSPTLFGGTSATLEQEGGGTGDAPGDGEGRGREGTGGTDPREPVGEPSAPATDAPETEPPSGDGGGTDEPTVPGAPDTADPGNGQAEPGTGEGAPDPEGTGAPGDADDTGDADAGGAEVPAG